MLEHERHAWGHGCRRLAGVDEAGRGPLAGPVVASAVYIERSFLEGEELCLFKDLNDSKQLSEARREHFFDLLTRAPSVSIGVGQAGVQEIDTLNILRATHLAMARALQTFDPLPDHALVDGLPVKGLPCASTAIVDGDALSLLIAAASVIAKVTRDRIMRDLDVKFPVYGFAKHKGYGTRDHLEALRRHGPCPFHRRSFGPVRQLTLDLM
ncbi:MAG: ribonuclease HII [Lentisphaerota bacterium]